jgi:hypothetical protein
MLTAVLTLSVSKGKIENVGSKTRIFFFSGLLALALGACKAEVVVTSDSTDDSSSQATTPSVTVSSVNPSSGVQTGGTLITITGSGFFSGPTVTIGGQACNSITFVLSTRITCVTPAHAGGPVDVTVTNSAGNGGLAGSKAAAFTYTTGITLTAVAPTGGPQSGGTVITLTGTGFMSGATVTLGSGSCAPVNVAAGGTSLTCTTPSQSVGPASITVTNPPANGSGTQTLSNAFTYSSDPAPTVTGISPTSGTALGGTSVTITGTDFRGTVSVTIGGKTCTGALRTGSTQITCTTGEHGYTPTPVDVAVTNGDGTQGSSQGAPARYQYAQCSSPTYTNVINVANSLGCLGCHPSSGGFSMSSYANTVTRVDTSGYNPLLSLLYTKVNSGDMPPSGGPATTEQKNTIKQWILCGAQNN